MSTGDRGRDKRRSAGEERIEGSGAAGEPRWQKLARRGVPTFLLLENAGGNAARRSRQDAEGEALGALAEEIDGGLPSVGRPWPGGIALTLERLAARRFLPASAPPGRYDGPAGELFRAFADGRYVRAVNFHATPRRVAGRLEAQLSRLAEWFAPVSFEDLRGLVRGEWPHDRPGVIVSFFDGSRDNFEVAAPILERVGLIGWFFVVSGWVATPPEDQHSFAVRHSIQLPRDGRNWPADGRLALSPGEVGALAEQGHVVASHTRHHATASPEFAPDLSPEPLEREVAGSRRELERMAGREVRALAWREGTSLGTNARADQALSNADYEFLFTNHAVQQVIRRRDDPPHV
jgi:peptidoglycan/xylan/chitin deacetylase (PgdA/CDA1 family)